MPGLLQPERTTYFHLDGTADISVRSMFTGKWSMMRLPITERQWDAWQAGDYIQRVMSNLSPEQREFLLTGATPEEWDAEFGGDDE